MKVVDVVIIGGGPAGISAAIWCKRLDVPHLLVESHSTLGGQLFAIHNKIIDYPGLVMNSGKELQVLFNSHIEELNCSFQLETSVQSIDPKKQVVTVQSISGTEFIQYRYLIVATGSKQRKLNVPGENEMIKRGEVFSATKDKGKFKNKSVIFVGGGDRAFEGAFLLAECGARVTLLHRSTEFRARKQYQDRVLSHPNITFITNALVTEIKGTTKVEQLVYEKEGQTNAVDTDAIFIRIGVEPNSSLVSSFINTDKDGYILVNKVGETSNPSIFAVGDVCNLPNYTSIAASVGQGMISAKQISEQLKINHNQLYF
ncbi:NAD(P)/FAD-dependent oxidoreductase [Alkalihalobacterium bogoriense]|uniref:NAD(P)/FAD-dependent oxidoreductase n=1 Tax=Alkalihalobacterium bogoriense TaxID=246272 RepID=UPI00047E0DD5|nr:NAD(P)/FAD-dependent oxidoreductase [Alkalihalobacterium bogoriense]